MNAVDYVLGVIFEAHGRVLNSTLAPALSEAEIDVDRSGERAEICREKFMGVVERDFWLWELKVRWIGISVCLRNK